MLEIGKDLKINEEAIIGDKNFEVMLSFINLIYEFVKVGFNHKSRIEKGRLRVTFSGNVDWLTWAILVITLLEYEDISLENIRKFYKVRKYKWHAPTKDTTSYVRVKDILVSGTGGRYCLHPINTVSPLSSISSSVCHRMPCRKPLAFEITLFARLLL